VNCPVDYDCNVLCHNTTGGTPPACEDTTINCGVFGKCALTCIQGPGAQPECYGTGATAVKLNCGMNACSASCGALTDKPTVTCGASCMCTQC